MAQEFDESRHPEEWLPRRQMLTQADLEELARLLAQHPCKFQVSHEQMDKIVRMSNFFEKIEDKVISAISWTFIAIIGGFFYLLYSHGYFWKK